MKMFTLGDVADILDSALDTGISIVDALAKLSDVAEKGPIDRCKAFDTLNISEVNNETSLFRSKRFAKHQNDLSIEEFYNEKDDTIITHNSSPQSPQHLQNETLSNNRNASENSSPNFQNGETIPARSNEINVESSISKSAFLREKGRAFTRSFINSNDSEDSTMQGLPIIEALGDLCNVADNFLNDYDDIETAVDSTRTSVSPPKLDHSQLEHVINDKVNQILESFKKLDLTVDQLSQRILKDDSKQTSTFINQPSTGDLHDVRQTDTYDVRRSDSDVHRNTVNGDTNRNHSYDVKKYNRAKRSTYVLKSPTPSVEEKNILLEEKGIEDNRVVSPRDEVNISSRNTYNITFSPNGSNLNTASTKQPFRGTYILSSDESNGLSDSSKSLPSNKQQKRGTYILSSGKSYEKLQKHFSLDLDDNQFDVSEKEDEAETPDSALGLYKSFQRKLSEPDYQLTLPDTPDSENVRNKSFDNLHSPLSDTGHFFGDTGKSLSRNYQFENLKSSSSHTLLPHGYKLMNRKYSYGLMPLSDRSASQPALHLDRRKRSVPITAPVMSKLSTLHSALSSSLNKLNKLHEIKRDISVESIPVAPVNPGQQTVISSKKFQRANSAPSEFSDNISSDSGDIAVVQFDSNEVSRQHSNSSGGTYTIISPSDSYQFIGKENSFVLIDSNESDKDDLTDDPDYYSSPVPQNRTYSSPYLHNRTYSSPVPHDRRFSSPHSHNRTYSSPNSQDRRLSLPDPHNRTLSSPYSQTSEKATEDNYLENVNSIIRNLEETLSVHDDDDKNNNVISIRKRQARRIDRNLRTGTYVIRREKRRPSSDELFDEMENSETSKGDDESKKTVESLDDGDNSFTVANSLTKSQNKNKTSSASPNKDLNKRESKKRPSLGAKSKTFSAGDKTPKSGSPKKSSKSADKKPDQPKHTNFLRRKKPGFGLNKKPENEIVDSTHSNQESRDEPLSSRLAALRMQLEEKRRQFEEEKKRKQEEWSQERAKMLTTAYLQMNGKENEDPEMLTKPTGLTSWEVHFDSTPAKTETTEAPANSSVPMAKYDGPSKPYVSPREYIRQKQLEQKQSSNDGLWFVNFDKDDDLSVEQNRHEFNSLQQDQSQEKFFRPTSDTGNNFYSPPDHQSAHVARSNEHEVTNLAHFSEHKSRTEAFEYTTIHFPYSRDPIESRSVSKQTSNFSQRPSKEETLEQRPQYKQRISSDEITSTSSDSLSRLRALRDVTSDISGHFSRQNATMTSASYQEPRFWWENSQENRPNTSPSYRHHENVSSSHVTSLQNNKSLSGGDFVMSPSSPASSYRSANSVPNTPRQKTDEFHSAKRFDYSSHPELSTRLTDHARENILTDHAHENMLKESHGYHQLPHLIMERNDDVMKQATHDDFHISPVQDGTSSTQHPDQNHVEDSSQCHSDHEGNELVLNLIRSSISQSEHSDSLSDYTPLSNQNAFADHAEKGVDFNHPPPYTPIDDTSYSHNEIHNAYDDRVHLPPSQNYTHVSNNQEELTSFKEHSLDVSSRQPVAIFTNDNRYRATEQAHNGVTDQSQLTNSETISSVVTNNSQSLASSQISAHIKIDSVTSDHSFDERSNVEVITKTIGEPTSSENVFSTPKKEVTGESSVGVITPSTGGAATTPSTGEENAANDKPTAWALNFGNQFESPEMTPEQKKKRDRFIRNRQKKQEEERAKKEAEQEKKRKKEERLAEQKQKEEEERMREIERRKQIELEEETSLLQQEGYSKRIHGMTYETNTPERHTNRPFSHRLPPRENAERSNHPRVQSANAATPPRRFGHGASGHGGSSEHLPSQFSEYKGPSVYQKPSGKSNRKIIQNAVMHCCLCGEVNKEAKNKCLEAINQSDGNHFLVLFREGLKFRSVYEYNPDHETVTRIYGIGPKSISGKMIVKYYKYNSGGKEFNELDTKHLSIQIDGIMIKKELWEKKQGPSKVDSNLARKKFTPRATGSGVNR